MLEESSNRQERLASSLAPNHRPDENLCQKHSVCPRQWEVIYGDSPKGGNGTSTGFDTSHLHLPFNLFRFWCFMGILRGGYALLNQSSQQSGNDLAVRQGVCVSDPWGDACYVYTFS